MFYTSDFVLDFGTLPQFRTDLNVLSEMASKGVLCLMCESTACTIPGHTSPSHKLMPLIESTFQEAKGRIIASVYAQNLFSVREIIDAAIKSNRKILVYSREMREILKRVTEFGILSAPPHTFIDYDDLSRPGN